MWECHPFPHLPQLLGQQLVCEDKERKEERQERNKIQTQRDKEILVCGEVSGHSEAKALLLCLFLARPCQWEDDVTWQAMTQGLKIQKAAPQL